MNLPNANASCQLARQIDLVSYLASLGFQPMYIRSFDYWYLSPLRAEKTPSFKINKRLNRWYDHGLGKGGNLIDFAIQYNNCTVGEFLRTLSLYCLDQQFKVVPATRTIQKEEGQIKIIKSGPLKSSFLIRYLYQRRISFDIARLYLHEVEYLLRERKYVALGFQNRSGGYELRNSFFKGSSAPKDITIFQKHGSILRVFEGFFDFLSFLSIYPKSSMRGTDFLVLNSVSFFEKGRVLMIPYQGVHLYLDQDTTGQNCTRYALSLGEQFMDCSDLYRHYKDLNEWLVHIGKSRHLLP